ncbi:MAG: SDR family NAD(P)-dependent oxidoreductase [Mycobacteriales bacterium]
MTSQPSAYPDLVGKVAVVTGGSRGIGAETARALAAHGVAVAVNGRDDAAIKAVVDSVESAGGRAIGVPADVTDPDALDRLRDRVEAELGPVDILAAYAGGDGDPVPVAQITPERWREVLEINATATFLTVRAFLPGMTGRGRGSIVTMASTAGRLPGGASAAYATAKAGVVMFTRHVALEVAKQGVRVNCLSPAAVLTDRLGRMPEEIQARVAAAHPLGRIGQPADVASATLFLASDSSSWITGVTLDVAGGRIMI